MGSILKDIRKVFDKVKERDRQQSAKPAKPASYLDVEQLYNSTSTSEKNIITPLQIKVGFKKGGKVKDAMPKAKPC